MFNGRIYEQSQNTNAITPPVSQPANGHSGTTRSKYSFGTLAMRQNGKRVKKPSAARMR